MRLRNQFVYYGAHTGRWSGRGVQPQNLTRQETDKEALKALLEGKPVNSLAALSTCIRPCIRAPHGYKLVVADLSAIENRVLAWLSGCEAMLQVYADNLDPYKAFGVEFYQKDYDQITKAERQVCKPAVLGCGYGLGGGQERQMMKAESFFAPEVKYVPVPGQRVKTGLWKYAEQMGVELSRADAHKMVNTFRSMYPEVPNYWYYLEDAFYAAFKTKKRQQVGAIYFTATPEAIKVELPSGRFLHYLNPGAWKGSEGLKLSFDGFRGAGWGRQSTWGGRITENIVQAVSRDVLAEGMKRAEKRGFRLVGHVHDELITECVSTPFLGRPKLLEECMSAPISWAPGLPLAAEGWEGEFYMKG
jgi:DNA polymerase bacteriophage-type